MANKLAALKNIWKKANENKGAGGFEEIEDGRYLTVISDAEVNESQASDRLQIMIAYKIQEGEFEKKVKRAYIGLDTEKGVQIAVNTLAKLGIEVEDPAELEEKIKTAIGKVCKIQLKTKSGSTGEFQNVYILKVVGTEAIEGAEGAEAVAEIEPEAEEPAKPEKGKKKAAAAPAPEPEPKPEPEPEPEPVPAEIELKVGMAVLFNFQKKEVEGKVEKIDEKTGKAHVRYGGKLYAVPCDQLMMKP